jgi:hypothetical protein
MRFPRIGEALLNVQQDRSLRAERWSAPHSIGLVVNIVTASKVELGENEVRCRGLIAEACRDR